MAISIRAAVKNIFSDKYDKKNILYYLIIVLIGGICGIYFNLSGKELSSAVLAQFSVSYLLYIVICVIAMGIYIVSANNGLKGENSIFANLFDDIKKIATTGIIAYAGIILIYIGLIFAIIIPGIIAVGMLYLLVHLIPDKTIFYIISAVFIVLLAIYLMFLIFIIVGLMMNYAKSLNFEDIINVSKAMKLISEKRKEFSVYILKSIAIGIIALIIFLPIFLITVVGVSVPSIFNNVALSDTQIGLIGAVLGCLFGTVCGLVQLDLQIQFLRETDKYIPESEDKDEPVFEDEYIEINEE